MRAFAAALALAITIAGASPARADAPPRAEPPVVELITIGRGDSLFEAFGHAALCVRYIDDSQSACFNYGVTEYDRPGALIWNFIRGTQVFWSEVSNYAASIEAYREQDRDMWRQIIPATPEQARAIANRLWHEADREHREYIYDHIADNCSTRLRDILDEELGGPLRAAKGVSTGITVRAVGARGFADAPFILAVTDLVLGRPMERTLDTWDAMFLPEMLRAEVTQRIGAAPEVIATRQGPAYPTQPSPLGRIIIVLLAVACALPLIIAQRRGSTKKWPVIVAALPLIVIGVALWVLAAISPIGFVRWNEALLVFIPLDAVLVWLPPERRQRWARGRVIMLLVIAVANVVGILHQPLWLPIATALVPLLALSAFAARDPDRPGGAETVPS